MEFLAKNILLYSLPYIKSCRPVRAFSPRPKSLIGIVLLLGSLASPQQPARPLAARDTVAVDFSMDHANSSASGAPFRQGETVRVRFSVRDKVSGAPLDGLHPAAWLDLHGEKDPADPVPCRQRVQKLLNANFLALPEIDLNGYYVLVMNNDTSISVVDPQFSSGAARMIATIPLASPAIDWQLSDDQKLLFVGMPVSGQIAVIDTLNWRLIRNVEIGQEISRVSMQPDGRRLWIAHGHGSDSGVAIMDVQNLQLAGKVQTGVGPHDIAFSSDSHLVFVSNTGSGTVSVLDSTSLSKTHEIRVGHQPGTIAFSAKSSFAYVTDVQDGTITVLNGLRGVAVTTIQADPGLGAIRFARDGLFAIVLNPAKKRIHVLDSSLNRIVQTGDADGQPDQVSFSSTLAHIRQRGSNSILMVPLDSIGAEQKPLPEAEFPGGQHAFGQASAFTPADGIVQAPGESAVLEANPGDRSVYYYEEGMAAPIGLFSTGSREPRALLTLDRSLKRSDAGVYETTTHLKRPGLYTVALLLESPPAVQCWDVNVQPDPNQPQPVHLELQGLLGGETLPAGSPVTLHFRIWDSEAKTAKGGAADVRVLLFRAPGAWHEYKPAKGIDGGIYEVSLSSLEPGIYYLNAVSPSLGLTLNGTPIIFQVVGK
jgi:YVTN family beta-propeller protein